MIGYEKDDWRDGVGYVAPAEKCPRPAPIPSDRVETFYHVDPLSRERVETNVLVKGGETPLRAMFRQFAMHLGSVQHLDNFMLERGDAKEYREYMRRAVAGAMAHEIDKAGLIRELPEDARRNRAASFARQSYHGVTEVRFETIVLSYDHYNAIYAQISDRDKELQNLKEENSRLKAENIKLSKEMRRRAALAISEAINKLRPKRKAVAA